MNADNISTLWDSIPEYKRKNPKSVNPPAERIDPDIPGAHYWVILVTNWDYLHPLIQDVLYDWYIALSKSYGDYVEELDPKSTESLINRLEELDQKLKSFDLERTNLEEELQIRDRDFQRLRSITGKREKENIEVQHLLGKSFQEKIMEKQEDIDRKEEYIKKLEAKIKELEANNQKKSNNSDSEEENIENEIEELKSTISKLKDDISNKDEKIKEIKDLLKL